MPVPIELVAAWMAISYPDEFTEEQHEAAREELERWKQLPCAQCVNGWIPPPDGGRPKLCRLCLGDAIVWIRLAVSALCMALGYCCDAFP